MKKLVLFDIDGTIMNTDGGGTQSCKRALKEVFGLEVVLDGYVTSGKTDTQIVLELMGQAGVAREETLVHFDAICERYLAHLVEEVKGWAPEVCPGIPPLLDRLSGMSDVVLGLLTGNIRRGAEVKLNLVGLWSYFRMGAFGDRVPERRLLPDIAQRAAVDLTGRVFDGKDIVIIGDTPNDVLCGRHLNVKAIAVATGAFGEETLKDYKPDYLFKDLGDMDQVVAAIMA